MPPVNKEGVAFGVPPVDSLLPPAPAGSSVLLAHEPGVAAEAFLYQSAATHLAAGREVVYLVTNRSPSSVVEAMEEHGFGQEARESSLHFIDAFSPLLGSHEGAAYTAEDPADLGGLLDLIDQAADEHPGAVLLLDSLSGLADRAGTKTLVEVVPRLNESLARFRYSVSLFADWSYEFDTTSLSDLFDAEVRIGTLEERVVFGQFLQLVRASWTSDTPAQRVPFKVHKPGGIHAYIPKIVVTGPYNAGKSTFVHTVSDTAVSVDRMGTTVALDHGHVTVNGVTADIFGTPGQARFDPILRTVAGHALGVIVLVDATKPDTIPRARELLEKTMRHGIPVLVGANKQDLPGALSPKEVSQRLQPPPHVRVVGLTGQDPRSSRALLEMMNKSIVLKGVPT